VRDQRPLRRYSRSPERLEWLCANPDSIEPAAEEFSCFVSPAQIFGRNATTDAALRGMKIPKRHSRFGLRRPQSRPK
jgi:cytochrome P450